MKWILASLLGLLLLCGSSNAQLLTTHAGVATPGGVVATGSSGGCTAATNFLARTSISGQAATDYTTFICYLVTNSIITSDLSGARGCGSKLDGLYVLGAPNQTDSLLNLCGTSYSLLRTGAGFSADNGWTGVDTSTGDFLDTQFNPTIATSPNMATNSVVAFIFSQTNATSAATGGATIGNQDGSGINDIDVFPRYNGGSAFGRANDNPSGTGVAVGDSLGFYAANRSGVNTTQLYKNGSNITSPNATTGTLQNVSLYLLAVNRLGVGAVLGGGYQLFGAGFGGSLSAGDHTILCHAFSVLRNARNGGSSLGC